MLTFYVVSFIITFKKERMFGGPYATIYFQVSWGLYFKLLHFRSFIYRENEGCFIAFLVLRLKLDK